jgi:hypothetical protein
MTYIAEEREEVTASTIFLKEELCTLTPVMPGLSGEIEELYVQPALGAHRQEIKTNLVRQAVAFM